MKCVGFVWILIQTNGKTVAFMRQLFENLNADGFIVEYRCKIGVFVTFLKGPLYFIYTLKYLWMK